jgi:peptidase E
MRKSGFDQYIYNFLHHGGIYLSTSAGSCVCAPDIEYAKYSDDSSIVELATYQGLHFCNLAINPHF